MGKTSFLCTYSILEFLFIYFFWLRWIFVAVSGLSPVVVRGGYSLISVNGLLIAVAPLVVEHRL